MPGIAKCRVWPPLGAWANCTRFWGVHRRGGIHSGIDERYRVAADEVVADRILIRVGGGGRQRELPPLAMLLYLYRDAILGHRPRGGASAVHARAAWGTVTIRGL